ERYFYRRNNVCRCSCYFDENLKGKWTVGIITAIVCLFVMLPSSKDTLIYEEILHLIKYVFSKKKYVGVEIDKLVPYTSFEEDGTIKYPEYYGRVIRIGCKTFALETEYAQERDIENFAKALSCLDTGKVMDIVKIDRPIIFDKYIKDLEEKLKLVNKRTKANRIRRAVLTSRIAQLKYLNTQDPVYRAEYYIVIYDSIKKELNRVSEQICSYLRSADLECDVLDKPCDVAVFLKYCNVRNFDEREAQGKTPEELLAWVKPTEIKFHGSGYEINNVKAFNYAIADYPLTVDAAWGAELFDMDKTKVVMHLVPVDQNKAISRVDKVCRELLAREEAYKASELLEQETHLESMSALLTSLQNGGEGLYDVTTVVTGFCYEDNERAFRKSVNSRIRVRGFATDNLYVRQLNGFVTSNISKRAALRNIERGINGGSIASVFPFVHTSMIEPDGVLYGAGAYPVIWNMWKKDGTHRNANTIIFGRPGSGKSYFLKSLLAQSLGDGCLCFVIDPENEYGDLVRNIDGEMIDVGSASKGCLNPFHIYQILTEDGNAAPPSQVYYSHLKTLESFFKVILEGCDADTLELINNVVNDVYEAKGITPTTDVSEYSAEQFPVFDDFFNMLTQKEKEQKTEKIKELYNKAQSYVKKFTSGGRYSDLWGKPSTLTTSSVMTVFNFQSLFANKNNLVANAQMLLVFRFLEQQVINIRERNRNAKTPHRIVIVADEAHLFIDPKYPIAVDFFYQMTKRIRKYDGTFIPATQNVADWLANDELKAKTSAVIKNTQYTFVFALNPSDVEDLAELYKNNPINEEEQNLIISAGMGQCFYIGAYNERFTFNIVTTNLSKRSLVTNVLCEIG
ncbi:MAG: DUF87 domain-containing protein, partial [Clostridia bacterium]|nr:DUF87 domain-containing protein [Clostridia bacterium]